jgi:type IV pilus assembly protein PilP
MNVRCLALWAVPFWAGADPGGQDLPAWTAQQRQLHRPATARPVPAQTLPPGQSPPPRPPLAPQSAQVIADPFSVHRLDLKVGRPPAEPAPPDWLLAEISRPKGLLEAVPLQSLAMVGTLSKDDGWVALVLLDRMVHQVRVGDYLGQDFGRVEAILPTALVLREIARDVSGQWSQRQVRLPLGARTS